MKLYDKIMVGDNDAWVVENYMLSTNQHLLKGKWEDKSGQIVMTIEESKEMWEACREETWQEARPTTKYESPDRLPDFEGYLQSKGIQL